MSFCSAIYPWSKSLHIISMVAWMAGLFYLPRIFVYHVEEAGVDAHLDRVFGTMERKLLTVIMTPAMIATWFFGIVLILTPGVVDLAARRLAAREARLRPGPDMVSFLARRATA